jgi:hypothetical protein
MMGQVSTGAVVASSERRGQPKKVQQGNQEWTTVIHGVNAIGWAILPWAISAWYKEDDLPHDWAIGVSENGWTTNDLGFEWLKHFDRHTKKRTVEEHCLLIVGGYGSHDSLAIQQCCKENKITTLHASGFI